MGLFTTTFDMLPPDRGGRVSSARWAACGKRLTSAVVPEPPSARLSLERSSRMSDAADPQLILLRSVTLVSIAPKCPQSSPARADVSDGYGGSSAQGDAD
jgi:hypothetical protein